MLTEQQRLDAIAACDRIEQLNTELQQRCANIIRILDNCANRRDPMDGVKEPAKP